MAEFMSRHPVEMVLAIIGLNGFLIFLLIRLAIWCGDRRTS